jgi:hypothetical protein
MKEQGIPAKQMVQPLIIQTEHYEVRPGEMYSVLVKIKEQKNYTTHLVKKEVVTTDLLSIVLIFHFVHNNLYW